MDLLKDCYWEASLPEDLPNLSREGRESADTFSLDLFILITVRMY